MGVILITHDLGVVAGMAREWWLCMLERWWKKEAAGIYSIIPITLIPGGFLHSIPRLDVKQEKLAIIPGVVPDPLNFPSGCRFRNRCPLEDEVCLTEPSRENRESTLRILSSSFSN